MEHQIFDIFLKKRRGQEKEIKKEKVIVDMREKNSLIVSSLVKLNMDVEFKMLDVADYIVKDVAIERKTVQDFIGSMINKRLIRQIEGLKQYENRLLIIEGTDEHEIYSDSLDEKKVNPNAIRGFILSISLKHRIPIIFTKNFEDSAKFISIISKKKEKEISILAKKSSVTEKDRIKFIIEGFPGIGPKTAEKLLNKFKTIKNIINAEEEELKKILGKKTENIKKIIVQNY